MDSTDSILAALAAERARISVEVIAPSTRKHYQYAWDVFCLWARSVGREPLPASTDTVSLYLTHRLMQGRKVSTVRHDLATLLRYHRDAGFPLPSGLEIRKLLRCARRQRKEPVRRVTPLTVPILRDISLHLAAEGTVRAFRNRAMLMIGFASALRSANVVSLRMEDLTFCEQGVEIYVRSSKTDQEGNGFVIGVPFGQHTETCPVGCLRDWLARRGTSPGTVFMSVLKSRSLSPDYMRKIVKRCVAAVGLDPKQHGSHSCRRGLVTAAAKNGIPDLQIAIQTGHKSMQVLSNYVDRTRIWQGNVAGLVGL